jgi:hypothetical protein
VAWIETHRAARCSAIDKGANTATASFVVEVRAGT